MKKETLNACWKKLWPGSVHDYKGFSPDEIQHTAVDKAVKLAKLLGGEGYDDITEEDVDTLTGAHSEPLTDADLEKSTKSASEKDIETELKADAEEEKDLTLERLSMILRTARNVQMMVKSWDLHMTRAIKFNNSFDALLQPYENLLDTLKKERQKLPITMFLTKTRKARMKPHQNIRLL
ncbi:hypothetical protein M514_05206 [Trichuris suis]|uniref:Uncharacterized protein n=1 Tax=Trichuris suis TaxID=68888 RepID=A0A085MU75_9BILA|nr:hypothetical protein M513_05206 [Trichuris suis]KFD60771.1 hypothetical protein M514_05206 [Trichuris suis]